MSQGQTNFPEGSPLESNTHVDLTQNSQDEKNKKRRNAQQNSQTSENAELNAGTKTPKIVLSLTSSPRKNSSPLKVRRQNNITSSSNNQDNDEIVEFDGNNSYIDEHINDNDLPPEAVNSQTTPKSPNNAGMPMPSCFYQNRETEPSSNRQNSNNSSSQTNSPFTQSYHSGGINIQSHNGPHFFHQLPQANNTNAEKLDNYYSNNYQNRGTFLGNPDSNRNEKDDELSDNMNEEDLNIDLDEEDEGPVEAPVYFRIVRDLPNGTTAHRLRDEFKRYGSVDPIKTIIKSSNGTLTGFVAFTSIASYEASRNHTGLGTVRKHEPCLQAEVGKGIFYKIRFTCENPSRHTFESINRNMTMFTKHPIQSFSVNNENHTITIYLSSSEDWENINNVEWLNYNNLPSLIIDRTASDTNDNKYIKMYLKLNTIIDERRLTKVLIKKRLNTFMLSSPKDYQLNTGKRYCFFYIKTTDLSRALLITVTSKKKTFRIKKANTRRTQSNNLNQ